jgi:hypothetical protein
MNQREEQRVIEALRALTGGLTVTQHDILTAGEQLRSRLEPPSPRRRLAALAIAACFVLLTGLIAFQVAQEAGDDDSAPPADTSPSAADRLTAALDAGPYELHGSDFLAGARPTPEDLSGLWLLRPPFEPAVLVIEPDGDWANSPLPTPIAYGTSTLDGRRWTRQLDGSSPCTEHDNVTALPWRAALAGDGSLRLQFIGTRNRCTPADDREVWDRATPGSPMLAYLRETSDEVPWASPAAWAWSGTYIAPATGHVLDVARDGVYAYYDDASLSPADQGRLDTALSPVTISGTCGNSQYTGSIEVGMTAAVEGYVASLETVRFTDSTGECPLVAERTWVKVG